MGLRMEWDAFSGTRFTDETGGESSLSEVSQVVIGGYVFLRTIPGVPSSEKAEGHSPGKGDLACFLIGKPQS